MFNVRLDLEYWPGGPIAAKLTKTSFFYRSVLLPGTYFDNVPLKYRALDLTSWPVFLPCPSSFVNVIHQERIIKYTINTVTKVPLSQSISLSKWMNLHKVFLFRVRLLGRRRLYSGSTNRRRFFSYNCEKRECLTWPETVWVSTSVKCEEGHDDHAWSVGQGLGLRDDFEHQDVSKRFKLGDPASPSSPSRPSSSNWLAGGWGSS